MDNPYNLPNNKPHSNGSDSVGADSGIRYRMVYNGAGGEVSIIFSSSSKDIL